MAGPNGRIMHPELEIGDSRIVLADETPAMGNKSPETCGGSPVGSYVSVEDLDAAWKRAVDAGAKPVMPPQEMFWGGRMGRVDDPFGHGWSLAQRVKDVTPEEIEAGQQAFLAQMQMQPTP